MHNAAAETKQHPADRGNAVAEAKQVLAANGKGYVLDPDNLEAILLADGVIDKPVVVISVAGASRKGKSFLLDMMLRYLTARDKSNWINEPATKGFPWRSGFRRYTTGILMWSQPIPVTLPDGTEAVTLLMDTQGTFDNQSTAHESSTVFALSTLLSSLQILNVTGNLKYDDLEHLHLFTEYGRMALDDTDGTKPFQKLLFLVRDWQFVGNFPLGAEGGDRLVKMYLEFQTGKSEVKQVRQHIRGCFSEINGLLLPRPGSRVRGDPNFSGNSADMDPTFITKLEELMPNLLAPENLAVKKIAGKPVTAGELYTYFGVYTELFGSDELPKPKNIVEATAEANNMAAMQEAKTQYIKEMECLLRDDEPSLGEYQLLRRHQESSNKAIDAFCFRKQMGHWKRSTGYRRYLLEDIDNWFKVAKQANNTKREMERLNAEQHNLDLVDTCKMAYRSEMEPVSGEDAPSVTLKIMKSAHDEAKRKAMDQFDAEKKTFDGVEKDSRSSLSEEIDAEFYQMLFYNELKKDAKNFKEAQANNKAVNTANRQHKITMTVMLSTGNTLTGEELQSRHQADMKASVEMFVSLKEGDELIKTTYLDNMKSDIDREMQVHVSGNKNKAEMDRIQTQIKEIEKEVDETKSEKSKLHIFRRLGDIADDAIDKVGEEIENVVEDVVEETAKTVEKVVEKVGEAVEDVVEETAKTAKKVVEKVGEAVEEVVEETAKTAEKVVRSCAVM